MRFFIVITILLSVSSAFSQRFIQVSSKNSSYFSFSDGKPYIPVGINLINPSGNVSDPEQAFHEIEEWMKNLSQNGGNYVRIWLSQSFWDVETTAGKYDEEKAKRIDRYIEMARKYNLRVKLTLEHFRSVTIEENPQKWATKFAYHKSNGGPLDSIREYIATPQGRALFLNKVGYYQQRYGSDTLVFGWELWNEMNAMKGPEDDVFYEWNETMLKAVKEKFPNNLVMQSLGSFDGEYAKGVYQKVMAMPGNEVAQVHRYLDLGAEMKVCHAPMDVICASAIRDLQAFQTGKPIILAETGAVEPKHAGPSKYYAKDTAGSLLHDILFAPFFTGAAGPGMSWHWESYVHKNNLWYHYARFGEAIKGIDPIGEDFVFTVQETDRLREYTMKGKSTIIIWCRDKQNTWEAELEKGSAPTEVKQAVLQVPGIDAGITVQIYDPWKNKWSEVKSKKGSVDLPGFRRSLIVKFPTRSVSAVQD